MNAPESLKVVVNVEGVTQKDLKQCLRSSTHQAAGYYACLAAVVLFHWLSMEFILVARSPLQRVWVGVRGQGFQDSSNGPESFSVFAASLTQD